MLEAIKKVIGEHEVDSSPLDISQSDWSDLTEYTSEIDDDTGCGQAVYDSSDGPRERGEEELMMSPPMNPNGGGGSNCPYGTYSTYQACINDWIGAYYSNALEKAEATCNCICLMSECNPSGGLCELTDAYWDCVSGPVTLTTSIISIVGGCVVACFVFPPCVGGCLAAFGITATAVFVGCLAAPGAVECS